MVFLKMSSNFEGSCFKLDSGLGATAHSKTTQKSHKEPIFAFPLLLPMTFLESPKPLVGYSMINFIYTPNIPQRIANGI